MIDLPGDYSYDLKSRRPELRLAHFLCCRCKTQPDMLESTAVHYSEGNIPNGKGAVLAIVTCHGSIEEIEISFEDAARRLGDEEKIPVFDNIKRFPPGKGFEASGLKEK